MSAGASPESIAHAAGPQKGAAEPPPTGGAQPSASLTLPATLQPTVRYEKCPHHAGECPGCGEAVKPAKAPSRLSAALRASPAPADLRDQLDQFLILADGDDRAELLAGGGQALFRRLKACLPREVTAPDRPRRKGVMRWLDLVAPLDRPPRDAQSVLRRARDGHWITQACADAGKGLPLDGSAKVKTADEGRALARFLPLLAEQIYADPRRSR